MEKKLSRRDLFRRVIFAGGFAAYAANGCIAGGIPGYRSNKEVAQQDEEIDIKKYTPYILSIAARLHKSVHSWSDYGPAPMFLAQSSVGIAVSEWAIRRDGQLPPRKKESFLEKFSFLQPQADIVFPRERNKDRRVFLCSLVATFFGRVVDNYSTVRVLSESQDPRFKEYGFDDYIFETNPQMDAHPDVTYLLKPKNFIPELIYLGLSYASPMIGSFTATGSFFAYSNNGRIEEIIDTGYKVGDLVKAKLQDTISN